MLNHLEYFPLPLEFWPFRLSLVRLVVPNIIDDIDYHYHRLSLVSVSICNTGVVASYLDKHMFGFAA